MSVKADLFRLLCRLVRAQRLLERQLQRPPRRTGALEARRFGPDLTLQGGEVEGFAYLTVSPQGVPRSPRHVMFLHGGAYVLEAMAPHRAAIERWVRQHGLTVTFVDYPLAPEHTCLRTLDVCERVYQRLLQQYPQDQFVFAGDSAGGGLALAMLQRLREAAVHPLPLKTVLVSPWVDVGMTHPDVAQAQRKDPVLNAQSLRRVGEQYAGSLPLSAPEVSPLFGDMQGLGEVLLLVGTHEVFLPDGLALRDKLAQAEGTQVSFVLGQRMLHDWIMMPIPEAKATLDEIAAFVLA